jgi:putative ATP-dependent endonuclease of OLD family
LGSIAKEGNIMKLTRLRLSNFQSFGQGPTVLELDAMCFLLGPNGAGKTAVLQALARLFGDPLLRRVRRADFHVPDEDLTKGDIGPLTLWIEAQFEFPELKLKGKHATIPGCFAHMRLESADGMPLLRFRLTATMDEDGDIEEKMLYVLQVDEHGEPLKTVPVQKHDRNTIQVHYLPARRDPSDHISYAANSLLGRALRAVDWRAESEKISELTLMRPPVVKA